MAAAIRTESCNTLEIWVLLSLMEHEDSDSPRLKLGSWWSRLTRLRKTGFLFGLVAFMASYEYIHDFGIKRPRIAFLSVLTMMIAGSSAKQKKE